MSRVNKVTGEIIKLFEVAGIYYVSNGGKEVMNSDFYPDAYRAYNRIEREGAVCAR